MPQSEGPLMRAGADRPADGGPTGFAPISVATLSESQGPIWGGLT